MTTAATSSASLRFFHGTAAAAFAAVVYANEIEAAGSTYQPISNQPINNDSYVAFAPAQITILSTEAVKCAARSAGPARPVPPKNYCHIPRKIHAAAATCAKFARVQDCVGTL